jgi:hypothetical protein
MLAFQDQKDMQAGPGEILRQIVGEQLSGVTFVMDYLQLQFNPPPILSAFTPVTVRVGTTSWRSGDDQFRNRLCEQITKIVKSVKLREGDAFEIEFEDASTISISLNPNDYIGPEAVNFWGRQNGMIVI